MEEVTLIKRKPVPRGRVVGVRRAHDTLVMLDDLTRAAASFDPRKRFLVRTAKASMLDMIAELEALRSLIASIKLPSCEACCAHVGTWVANAAGVRHTTLCDGCYERLADDNDSTDDCSDYARLDWADQAEHIEEIQKLWGSTEFNTDVHQVSFEFRTCGCGTHG